MASLPSATYALISIGDFAIKLTLLGFSQIIKLLINSSPHYKQAGQSTGERESYSEMT